MKTLCIVQARISSTRLPGKILKEINRKPMLWYVLERLKKSEKIDKIVLATSDHEDDNEVIEFCRGNNQNYFRGSLNDVLKRFADCAREYPEFDTIVRVTGDCPLIDPEVVDEVVSAFKKEKADYASNALKETYPDGIDVEVFTRKSLLESDEEAKLGSEREHVTLYIRNNPKYKKVNIENDQDLSKFRLTVDNPEDFEVIKFLIENYGYELEFKEYCDLLLENPEVMAKNAKIVRNEGLLKSLKEDKK
ncbi:MAG: glycosyltransferase family protein [Candidatus Paceibacterota bacterium]|nr:MAG: glycosyltransferase family protein [Candidatus Paceibacterota bacterium]